MKLDGKDLVDPRIRALFPLTPGKANTFKRFPAVYVVVDAADGDEVLHVTTTWTEKWVWRGGRAHGSTESRRKGLCTWVLVTHSHAQSHALFNALVRKYALKEQRIKTPGLLRLIRWLAGK